ncbi:hypothetical protein C2S51_011372 [Perilla frutescens var. frutescens]|nr:hypothetical protein C2S51_011372 [Perilla frutescens var. frutescens]
MTGSDRKVRLELHHGGKFVGDNAYIGGKVDIIEDYDYCLFDYDELLFLMEELGIDNELDELKLYVEAGDVGEGTRDGELENEIVDGLEYSDFSSDDDEEKPEKFVDKFYYKSNYVETFKHALIPIHGRMRWPFVNEPPILPPQYTKRLGRPKKNRIRKYDEFTMGRQMVTTSSASEIRLNTQGYGARFSHESENVFARILGERVQYISGARAAAAAVSNLRSKFADQGSSTGFEDSSNQNSQVIDSAPQNPTS